MTSSEQGKKSGPYAGHSTISAAIITGPDDFLQSTSTLLGARRLADLLNQVDSVVERFASDIVRPNMQCDAKEIVAAAVARSLGWRLELPCDRKARLECERFERLEREREDAAS